MTPIKNNSTDGRLNLGIIITLGLSMLCPEYIAPIFIFVLFIYFKRLFSKTNRKALMGTMGKVFFVYMCYMLASAIWSKTTLVSILVPLLWMGCFLGYVLLSNSLNKKEKIDNAIIALSICAGVIGLIAVIEIVCYNLTIYVSWFRFLFPNPLYYEINDKFFKLLPLEVINYRFRSRASASFDNPLILATYLVMSAPFCAFGSVYLKNKKTRMLSRFCLLFTLGGIVCTSSRGSYVAVGLALVFMILFSNRKMLKKMLPFVIILLITVPVGLFLRFKNTPAHDFSISDTQRINIWKGCLEMFLQHPILGLGAGSDNIHTILRETYSIDRTHAHNLILEMLVEGGIIGGAFTIALIVLIVKNLVKLCKARDGEYKTYGIMYSASLIAFFSMSMFEHTLQSAKELMMFFFVLGLSESTLRIAQGKEQLADDEILEYETIDEEEKEVVEV